MKNLYFKPSCWLPHRVKNSSFMCQNYYFKDICCSLLIFRSNWSHENSITRQNITDRQKFPVFVYLILIYGPFVSNIFLKWILSQIMCPINTYILVHRHARCYCKAVIYNLIFEPNYNYENLRHFLNVTSKNIYISLYFAYFHNRKDLNRVKLLWYTLS